MNWNFLFLLGHRGKLIVICQSCQAYIEPVRPDFEVLWWIIMWLRIGGAFYILYHEIFKKPDRCPRCYQNVLSPPAEIIRISSDQLSTELSYHARGTDNRFSGQVMVVQGEISAFEDGFSPFDQWIIVLDTEHDIGPRIRCIFPVGYRMGEYIHNVDIGHKITVIGKGKRLAHSGFEIRVPRAPFVEIEGDLLTLGEYDRYLRSDETTSLD